jgi:hypothetical protein
MYYILIIVFVLIFFSLFNTQIEEEMAQNKAKGCGCLIAVIILFLFVAGAFT